jgi:hypothetical protein
MRQRTMLAAALILTIATVAGCAVNPTPVAVTPTSVALPPTRVALTSTPAVQEPSDGLIPVASSGDGATLVLSGVLTRETFTLESLRVVASRLAGRSSDPDQFRVMLLGPSGRELGTVTMWSPLTQFEWDMANEHEVARTWDKRRVDIPIPASVDLQTVVLGWPAGKVIARFEVGDKIREFCSRTPDNPACRPR